MHVYVQVFSNELYRNNYGPFPIFFQFELGRAGNNSGVKMWQLRPSYHTSVTGKNECLYIYHSMVEILSAEVSFASLIG